MTANRQERRSLASQVRALTKKRVAPGPAWEAICAVKGHDLPGAWVMRPAVVGAGLVIPKVHFDRHCRRCRKLDSVWADIDGATSPQVKSMTLAEWLEANGATVTAPAGEIRVPDQAELERISRLVRRGAANDAAVPPPDVEDPE